MSQQTAPFYRTASQSKITAAVAAPAGAATTTGKSAGHTQYMVFNQGNNDAWVGFGIDAATAQANSVVPTGVGANAKPCYSIPARTLVVITEIPSAFVSAVTIAGTSDIYITPGDGA